MYLAELRGKAIYASPSRNESQLPQQECRSDLQSNLNSSNTDGSFTLANSISFLSPYEILSVAKENKYLGKFSYFIMKLYVVCTH